MRRHTSLECLRSGVAVKKIASPNMTRNPRQIAPNFRRMPWLPGRSEVTFWYSSSKSFSLCWRSSAFFSNPASPLIGRFFPWITAVPLSRRSKRLRAALRNSFAVSANGNPLCLRRPTIKKALRNAWYRTARFRAIGSAVQLPANCISARRAMFWQ